VLSSAARLGAFDLWGGGCPNQDVVGESHYLKHLQRLLPTSPKSREFSDLDTTALLLPEPANRHDPNAVCVQVGGSTAGYLPRELALVYQPLLLRLRDQGFSARVPCRIWGGNFTDYTYDRSGRAVESTRFNASDTVALAAPHLCLPMNDAPEQPHVLLPEGRSIQVSGDNDLISKIEHQLRTEGESHAYATLHPVRTTQGRTTKEIVEVRVNGCRVGQLTPKMGSDLTPAIHELGKAGRATAVRAKITGNRLTAKVTLHCLRAHELPSDWPGELPPVDPRDLVLRLAAVPGGVQNSEIRDASGLPGRDVYRILAQALSSGQLVRHDDDGSRYRLAEAG
jgi:hypothetical protein